MKKIILAFAGALALSLTAVNAADNTIRIEGEDYAGSNLISVSTMEVPEFSEGKCAWLWDTNLNKGSDYSLTYTFTAPKKGTYTMEYVCMQLGQGWSTDFYIQINGGEEALASQNMNDLGRVQATTQGIAEKYQRSVKLKKGLNTVKIRINHNDKTQDNVLFNYIDYMEFKAAEESFKFESLTCDAQSNVFNYGEAVVFNAGFSCDAQQDRSYSYEVINSDEEIVKQGNITVREGTDSQTLYLPDLAPDWYRIEIFEYGTKDSIGIKKMFSVIEPVAAESIENNHFAIDTANYHASSAKVVKEQANVANRLGIDWTRERGGWRSTTEDIERYDSVFSDEIDEGLNVLNMFEHGSNKHETNSGDLFEVYNMTKNMSKYYNGKGMAIEIWNEPDGLGKTSADLYASFLKAAAIGVSDGAPDTIKTNGGLAYLPTDVFNRLLFQNDMMSYIDAFAYHSHEGWSSGNVAGLRDGKAFPNVAHSLAYDKTKPIWLNESGISVAVGSDGIPDIEAQRAKGNHLLKSSAQSISLGNDKRFWFLWTHYMESAKDFGNFSESNEPYISINVMNVMVKTLKESIYRGPMANLPDGATGYLINNGASDVAVVWSNTKQTYSVSGAGVTAMDMLGKALQMTDTADGKKAVEIGDEPIYICFNGECDIENYYPAYNREGILTAHTYDKAQRVIIQQLWENQDLNASKTKGYLIEDKKEQRVTVKVYNFNDEAVSGVIDIDCYENFTPSAEQLEFNVEPMSCQDIEMTFTLPDDVVYGTSGDIAFEGTLSTGEKMSPSIAFARAEDKPRIATDIKILKDYDNPDKWDKRNRAEGNLYIERTENPGEIQFTPEKTKAAAIWCYCKFPVEDGAMADTNGFTYKIKLASDNYTKAEKSATKSNIYVYMKDGSSYFIQEAEFIPYTNFSADEWTQITIPWNTLIMWEGDGSIAFDPANIKDISVGFNNYNASTVIPSYILKDLGTYVSDNPADSLKAEGIELSGIEKEGHYSQTDGLAVSAKLPDGKYSHIKVLLQDDFIFEEDITDNNVNVNVGKLDRGYYRLELIAEGERNLKDTATVYFYVD